VIATVSEAQARAMLQAHPGDGIEAWLADQPWHAAEDGSWRVEPDRKGWTYRVDGMLEAVRIVARAPEDGSTTSWLIML
jgi:hypothetical protein